MGLRGVGFKSGLAGLGLRVEGLGFRVFCRAVGVRVRGSGFVSRFEYSLALRAWVLKACFESAQRSRSGILT